MQGCTTDIFRDDVQDGHDATDYRDVPLMFLDVMYKMDMMATDYRDVHDDPFRRDVQDGHDDDE